MRAVLTAVTRMCASKDWVRPILVSRAVSLSAGLRLALVDKPVDNGIEKSVGRGEGVPDQRLVGPRVILERADRLRSDVTDGHHSIVRKDEPDGVASWMPVLDTVERAKGHVERSILLVEATRRLDFAHVLAGRHLDPDALLDQLVLLAGGLLQVDPGRIVRDSLSLGRIDDAPIAVRTISAKHGPVD
jgi:hypothetical protein